MVPAEGSWTIIVPAATSVPLTWSSVPETKNIIVDRPFLFGLYDPPTAAWLFLGHVVDPTQ